MTDKEKIREEVERLKLYTMDEHMKSYSESAEAEYNALCKVKEQVKESVETQHVNETCKESDNSLTQEDAMTIRKEWFKHCKSLGTMRGM